MLPLASLRRLAFTALIVAGFALTLCGPVFAQDSSSTDQGTPSALARGAHPLGSYGGGDIDVVNLFNGNLSVRLPLAAKDGRGSLGAALLLGYNSKIWRTEATPDGSGGSNYSAIVDPWDLSQPELARGWTLTAGRMTMRRSGKGSNNLLCTPGSMQTTPTYMDTLTTLTFTSPDGTEYSFRDYQSNGQFQTATCSGYNRKQVWYATDGTAATFVSDADIYDNPG